MDLIDKWSFELIKQLRCGRKTNYGQAWNL